MSERQAEKCKKRDTNTNLSVTFRDVLYVLQCSTQEKLKVVFDIFLCCIPYIREKIIHALLIAVDAAVVVD